eukprot:scaffold21800_cov82-Phaeocystis_antarctica.AAC.1
MQKWCFIRALCRHKLWHDDERPGDARHGLQSKQIAVLSARNGRVRQIASHMAVSFSKATHSVLSVADATDMQAGTQPKIVAYVMQRSALIAPLRCAR